MKQSELIRIICKEHCVYYKEGEKEEMACGAYDEIEASNSLGGLSSKLERIEPGVHDPLAPNAKLLKERFCPTCEFYIEGCDYTDPEYSGGGKRPPRPCGGFIVLVRLMDNRDVTIEEIIEIK